MKNYSDKTKETYNIISKDWQKKRQYYWSGVVDFLEFYKNIDFNLLDVGCGTARHLELALKLGFKKENLIGLDFSKEQLEITKEKGFKIKLSNMEDLDFKDESFDLIICIASYHHILEKKNQIKALKEIQRVLKKNGKLLLCNWMPNKEFIYSQEKKGKFKFIDKKRKKVNVSYTFEDKKFSRYYYLFSEDELKKQCRELKFKILNIKKIESNLYFELEKV